MVSCPLESQLDQGCLSRKGKGKIPYVNPPKVYLGVSDKIHLAEWHKTCNSWEALQFNSEAPKEFVFFQS